MKVQLFLLLCFCKVFFAQEVQLEISPSLAQPGTEIVVVCRISNFDEGNHVVYLVKRVDGMDGSETKELIATGTIKNGKYQKEDRYKMEAANINNVKNFILTITNAKVDDGGHYTCAVPNANDISHTAKLDVFRNPTKVEFTNVTSGMIDTMDGDTIVIQCASYESVPLPEMAIGRKLPTNEQEDLTETFKKKSTTNVKCPNTEQTEMMPCKLHVTYDQTLTNREFHVRYYDHGAQFNCTAMLPEQTILEPMTSTVKLNVKHVPHFICENRQTGRLMRKGKLSCIISTNPSLTKLWIDFTVSNSKTVISLIPFENAQTEDYKASVKQLNETFMEVTLTFDTIKPSYFRQYNIHAENPLSGPPHKSSWTVKFREDASGVAGGASGIAGSLSFCSLLLVFVLLASQFRQ